MTADVRPLTRWFRHEEPVQTAHCHLIADDRAHTLCGLRIHVDPTAARVMFRSDGPAYRMRRLTGDEPDRFWMCHQCLAVEAGHQRDCATWDIHATRAEDCWCNRAEGR